MISRLGLRVGFTIGALLVYRLGTYIPLPGIDSVVWAQISRAQGAGILGVAGVFSGGGVQRMAVLALGLTPLFSAAVILQLASMAFRTLRSLPKQGERGRSKFNNCVYALTFLLAVFQAFGVASALEGVTNVVSNPGWTFRLSTTAFLAGGTMFLVWLSGQITARGVGNGLALILFLGVILDLPAAVAGLLELGRQGVVSSNLIIGVAILAAALTALIVYVELAQRELSIFYPGREPGLRAEEVQARLRVKLNSAGVIPAILASWLLAPGRPLMMIVYALAMIVCVFLYTAFLLDPEEVADDLKRHGGVIAGVAPGEATATYVDHVFSRTTMIGAAYLASVCLIPEILLAYANVPFYLGGTSLLIVVCAILDMKAQFQGARY